jgi:hypothetical protein
VIEIKVVFMLCQEEEVLFVDDVPCRDTIVADNAV